MYILMYIDNYSVLDFARVHLCPRYELQCVCQNSLRLNLDIKHTLYITMKKVVFYFINVCQQ